MEGRRTPPQLPPPPTTPTKLHKPALRRSDIPRPPATNPPATPAPSPSSSRSVVTDFDENDEVKKRMLNFQQEQVEFQKQNWDGVFK